MLQFTIMPGRGGYQVILNRDGKTRTMYTIKKKPFGGFVIRDVHKYSLYTLSEPSEEPHPVYHILLNDRPKGEIRCRSKFLEPCMELEMADQLLSFAAQDERRLRYSILHEKTKIGKLEVIPLKGGEYKFELKVEESFFDDYLPLVPLATVESIQPRLAS